MRRRMVLIALFIFIVISITGGLGFLNFLPGPVGILLWLSSFIFLFITRIRVTASGNLE